VYARPGGRRDVVAALLASRPRCEAGPRIAAAGLPSPCTGLSVDVHEVKTRGRGGSILDPANLLAVCRRCHDWIDVHQDESHALGLLAHSWD
jgi:hypothetical protein